MWLYEELYNNYIGYIVPLCPEKNIWTKINQEGAEFSEKRKAELIAFIKRLINHKHLSRTIELHKFLLDQHAYHDYKNLKTSARNDGLLGSVTKVVYQSLPGYRRGGMSEPTPEDIAIQNAGYYLQRLDKFMQEILKNLQKYHDLNEKQSAGMLNATNLIQKILKTTSSSAKSEPLRLNLHGLSEIEDSYNKNLLKDVEPQLKVTSFFKYDQETKAISSRSFF